MATEREREREELNRDLGFRSVVTRDVPSHTMAHGIPARPRGKVGDRSETT